MKIIDLVTTANRNILKTKLRTFLTILAIMVGSIGLTLSFALGTGTNQFFNTIMSLFITQDQVVVNKLVEDTDEGGFQFGIKPEPFKGNLLEEGAFRYLTQSDIDTILTFQEVKDVYPEPLYRMDLSYLEHKDSKLVGEVEIYRSTDSRKDTLDSGDLNLVDKENQVALSQGFIETLGFDSAEELIGKKVTLHFKNLRQEELVRTMKVGAILKPTLFINNKIVISESLANEVLSFSNIAVENTEVLYSTAIIALAEGVTEEELLVLQAEMKELGLMTSTTQDFSREINNVITGIQAILILISAVVIVVALFGVINTLLMSVFERTQEIGLMRALGMRRRGIFFLLSFEAASIGFWGSIAGFGAGFLLGKLGNRLLNEHVFQGIIRFDPLVFTIPSFVIVVVSVSIICLLAGFFPAIRAMRLDPIVALRSE